jgi:hypothetical protein
MHAGSPLASQALASLNRSPDIAHRGGEDGEGRPPQAADGFTTRHFPNSGLWKASPKARDRHETALLKCRCATLPRGDAPQGARYWALTGLSGVPKLAVFVLGKRKKLLMPCSEKRARLLLSRGRAVVHPLDDSLEGPRRGDVRPAGSRSIPAARPRAPGGQRFLPRPKLGEAGEARNE